MLGLSRDIHSCLNELNLFFFGRLAWNKQELFGIDVTNIESGESYIVPPNLVG